jgi:sugar phosphate isomerase/epimerase
MAPEGVNAVGKTMKLGLHTYTLHLWGLGQNWGIVADPRPKEMNLIQLMDKAVEWGLDGLHITGCDLETKDDARLEAVKAAAASRNLYLEYNCSRDEEFDPRLSDGVAAGVRIAEKLGADLAKLSLDIRRPRPLYGSCFHPQVMRQLCDCHDEVVAVLPLLEQTGIKLALENHTETFADEILWLRRNTHAAV